jgi:hypothetical protein
MPFVGVIREIGYRARQDRTGQREMLTMDRRHALATELAARAAGPYVTDDMADDLAADGELMDIASQDMDRALEIIVTRSLETLTAVVAIAREKLIEQGIIKGTRIDQDGR